MIQILVFGGMLTCAMVPFALMTWLMRSGQTGLALTVIAVIGATLVIFIYASGRPFGVDPVFAMGAAMLACVPAFLGGMAGVLLGWLLRRQDDRAI